MKTFALVAVLLVGLMLAGCESGPTTPEKDAQGRYVIHLLPGNRFAPATLTIPVNSTVIWVNDDSAVHNVHAQSPVGAFDSPGSLEHGATYQKTFTSAASYSYECTYHSGMTATLTVA